MIQKQDTGIITKIDRFGEHSLILSVFTEHNGLMRGIVRQGHNAKGKAVTYQIGAFTEVLWSARLDEHLGNFTLNIIKSYASSIMNNYLYLEGLSAVLAEISLCLPERQPFQGLFKELKILLDNLNQDVWPALFVIWEKSLLSELGFSMDLEKCALTGETENLAFVSPRTARAVTEKAAGVWKDKLLPLPAFMLEKKIVSVNFTEIAKGLDLTGFFLNKYVFLNKEPAARTRFYSLIRKKQK